MISCIVDTLQALDVVSIFPVTKQAIVAQLKLRTFVQGASSRLSDDADDRLSRALKAVDRALLQAQARTGEIQRQLVLLGEGLSGFYRMIAFVDG